MSASNWAECPRCKASRKTAVDSYSTRLADAYGKVPVEEFDAMRVTLADLEDGVDQRENEYTLREDYEIWGIEQGEVQVRYHGVCSVCHLALQFAHAHPVEGLS